MHLNLLPPAWNPGKQAMQRPPQAVRLSVPEMKLPGAHHASSQQYSACMQSTRRASRAAYRHAIPNMDAYYFLSARLWQVLAWQTPHEHASSSLVRASKCRGARLSCLVDDVAVGGLEQARALAEAAAVAVRAEDPDSALQARTRSSQDTLPALPPCPCSHACKAWSPS